MSQITSRIPIPEGMRAPRYPFAKLKRIGQSFPVDEASQYKVRNACRAYAAYHGDGLKFIVRRDPKTQQYRCWRIS